MVSLVLIPTRHELSRAQKESMWFTTEEIQEFRWECYLNSKRVENQARIAQALATAAATSAPPCTSGVVLTSRRRASVPQAAAPSTAAAAAATTTAATTAISTKGSLADVERAPIAIVGAKQWQHGRVCV
eukprot:6866-Heterococcus_DN1.PRE.3